ncbi:MAG: SET domain-containing protein-lysine N-methyltransferase [Myxococcota bacterium]
MVHLQPERLTVQVEDDYHIELDPTWLRFLEHSCAPNVALDMPTGRVVALRAIAPGEVLAYFYPSTEWEMAAPFVCRCGSPECLGTIAGASRLPLSALTGRWLAPHIARRLGLERRETAST